MDYINAWYIWVFQFTNKYFETQEETTYDSFWNCTCQTRYENLLLHSWWLLKEPIVVLLEQKVFGLFNLRIRTGCVPAS